MSVGPRRSILVDPRAFHTRRPEAFGSGRPEAFESGRPEAGVRLRWWYALGTPSVRLWPYGNKPLSGGYTVHSRLQDADASSVPCT